MLIQFNFRNFKSYKNEVSLDMTATSIKEHEYNLIALPTGEKYLKVAAVYGANASGKTGIIDAFSFMCYFVMSSFSKKSENKGIPVKRFAFSKASRQDTSEFEVFFTIDDTEYQYGFVVDSERVHQEWLYKRRIDGNRKYETLFERGSEIKCGKNLSGAEVFVDVVEDSTLFLSLIANSKIVEAKKVYEWFNNAMVLDFDSAISESLLSRLLPIEKLNSDSSYRHGFEHFLKAIDMGIDGIRIEEIHGVADDDNKTVYRVYTRHATEDGDGFIELPLSEESSGTQKMFFLYYFLTTSMENGSILFVDELDAKLHPLLLRYIINLYHNSKTNKKGAQLIYSTHDIYTLNKETFRRDEIWFAEKNTRGVSELFSLAEYRMDDTKKVRNDASYDKDYLSGRYGAIPLLKEFNLYEEI